MKTLNSKPAKSKTKKNRLAGRFLYCCLQNVVERIMPNPNEYVNPLVAI
ncbi:hypothetical protein [Pseudomonas fluorescens]|nr:hypothetical protein [Pseudomonas fluorescens]